MPQLPEDTVYYIEAIPPVTQAKAADENFTLERIRGVNEKLALLAYQHGMHYLDLYGALCGEDGYLKVEYAADDGMHLNNEGLQRLARDADYTYGIQCRKPLSARFALL